MKPLFNFPEPIPLNEINQYIKAAKSGNRYARNQIIIRNGRLVLKYCKEFVQKFQNYVEWFPEFIQEGFLGLSSSIDSYSMNSTATFVSYALMNIDCRVRRFVAENINLVHVPANLVIKKLYKCNVSVNEKYFEYYMNMTCVKESDFTEEQRSLFNNLISKTELKYDNVDMSQFNLLPREEFIINELINKGKTNCEVAKEIHTSRQRVSWLKRRAINKISKQINKSSPRALGV